MSKITVIIIKDTNTKPWQMTVWFFRLEREACLPLHIIFNSFCWQIVKRLATMVASQEIIFLLSHYEALLRKPDSLKATPSPPEFQPCVRGGRAIPETSEGSDEPTRAEFWQRDLPRLHRNLYVSAIVSCPAPVWARWHHLALSRWNIAAGIE